MRRGESRKLRNRSVYYSQDIWNVCEAAAVWALKYGFAKRYDKRELANIVWLIQARYKPTPDYINCKRSLCWWLSHNNRLDRRDWDVEREYGNLRLRSVEPSADVKAANKDTINFLRSRLSGRNQQLFDFLARGLSCSEIAPLMRLSKERVRQLRASLLTRLRQYATRRVVN